MNDGIKSTQEEILKNLKNINNFFGNFDENLPNFKDSITKVEKEFIRIEEQISLLNNSLDGQSNDLQELKNSVQNLKQQMEAILPSVRNEVSRMTNNNEDLHKLFNERFENLKDRVDGIRQDVVGIRERELPRLATQESLTRIETKVDELPTMKEIVKELVDSNSPLATKSQLHKIDKDLAWVKGGLAINLVAIIGGLLVIWLSVPKIQAVPSMLPAPSPSPTSNR